GARSIAGISPSLRPSESSELGRARLRPQRNRIGQARDRSALRIATRVRSSSDPRDGGTGTALEQQESYFPRHVERAEGRERLGWNNSASAKPRAGRTLSLPRHHDRERKSLERPRTGAGRFYRSRPAV